MVSIIQTASLTILIACLHPASLLIATPPPSPSDFASDASLPFQRPLQLPFISSPSSSSSASSHPSIQPVKTVAIIGGGPAGTSAAFFLSKFANESRNPVELHLYESSPSLGGRVATIHPFDSLDYPPIEAGASIFVPANKHLHQAVRQFNLTTLPFPPIDSDQPNQDYAIWDGTEFAYESSQFKWWDTLKLIWRYGWAPSQLNSITQRLIDRFETIYSDQFISQGPFERLDRWVNAIGFDDLLAKTGSQYLINDEGINVQAVNELAAIMVRTNYGQDICHIHGLGAVVSLAGSKGSTSVEGGNRLIFEGFANRSHAQVHLNHQITAITELVQNGPAARPMYQLSFHDLRSPTPTISNSQLFDAVILAAPYHQASITILNLDQTVPVPNQPFVRLHVTFIVTNATAPSGELFNRPADQFMARSIYSTMMRNTIGKGKRPIFNSLNYLKNLGPKPGVLGDMYIVKMFSEAPLPTNTLAKLFGGNDNLLWIKCLEWDAYPLLSPLTRPNDYGPTKLGQKIYYVNGFESIASTMETQTIASWNIASYISDELWDFSPKKGWAQ